MKPFIRPHVLFYNMSIWRYFSCLLVHIGPISSSPWCSAPGRDVCRLDVWLHCPLQEMPSRVLVQGFEETNMNHTSGDVTFTYFQLKIMSNPHQKRPPSQWDMVMMELKFWIFRNQESSITINHRPKLDHSLLESLHLRVFWLHQQYLGDVIPRGHRGLNRERPKTRHSCRFEGLEMISHDMARHEDRWSDRN